MWKCLGLLCVFLATIVSVVSVCPLDPVADDDRIDCYPDGVGTELLCEARRCIWCESRTVGSQAPSCYIPKEFGYSIANVLQNDENGFILALERATTINHFGESVERLTVQAEFQSNYRLRIKITDTDNPARWEVPLNISAPAESSNANRLYDVEYSERGVTPFWFKVIRRATGTVLFDTSLGGLTFADQFIQISTILPSKNLYGIGENEQHSFRHKFDGYPNFALWARDQAVTTGNLYGVHPYYTVLENEFNAHSVAILNSNAQEFNILPKPGILYRTIGGVLDLYFFLGPTPEQVVQQYTEAVGRFYIPPYYSLGFHLCRYGYNSLSNMKEAVDRTAAARIPHDTQWGDIDIMDRALDFTISEDRFSGLAEYVLELKTRGIKFITILDPCISFSEPIGSYAPYDTLRGRNTSWIRRADDGFPVVGKVWPEDPVYFPDYTNVETQQWWINHIVEFKKVLDFDALWIDMNEPANFGAGDIERGCAVNNWNTPPYIPKILEGSLADKTLCPDHIDHINRPHYNTHSMYGWFQSEPTLTAMKAANNYEKRGFILSRSTFLGSGKWAAHWLGDNWSRWSNLHYSIIGMLQFNQFGIPFVGVDICGFFEESNADLCQRWMQLGAFYPFSRNHNGEGYGEQDPAFFGEAVAESSRKALEIRYTLLPYLYTLFYHHATKGSTVARPLWHEYPEDANTYDIDRQFLWGSGFMISPVLDEHVTSILIYVPDCIYYSYYDGTPVPGRGSQIRVSAPEDFIPLFVRGGHILPTQEPAINTEISRRQPLGLIVALNGEGSAKGQLYYDSGDSPDPIGQNSYFLMEYEFSNDVLTGRVIVNGYADMRKLVLGSIRIFGYSTTNITVVQVNDLQHYQYSGSLTDEVVIRNINIIANRDFNITFNKPLPPPEVTTTEAGGSMIKSGHMLFGLGFVFALQNFFAQLRF